MKTNESLQKDVQDAIKWEPLLHAAEIGVIVKDGIVTLTGTVDSYSKKIEAETAAKKVAGVKAVVEDIDIDYGHFGVTTDEEVATEVVKAFQSSISVPDEKIKVKVEDGWVTIDGTVNWDYQRRASKNAIVNLKGVKGVTNSIKIKSELKDEVEKEEIEKALQRNWALKSDDIYVDVNNNKVKLTGLVDSFYEKEEAERIAWNAPGVCSVNNELAVGSFD
jgi:osmotically-inducible protein OsmY